MTFDQDLAARVRAALVDAGVSAIREVKMFGGTSFLLNGNMVAAASKRGLLVRVGKDRRGDALAEHGARPIVMRGRTMEGYIYVDPPALKDRALQKWLQLAVAFVQTLPPNPARQKPKRVIRKRK
jgi:TfoX/Sxy family transcriptional regulator of competence genes